MILVRKARKDDALSIADLHKGEGWCYDEEVVLNDYWDDDFNRRLEIVDSMFPVKPKLTVGNVRKAEVPT